MWSGLGGETGGDESAPPLPPLLGNDAWRTGMGGDDGGEVTLPWGVTTGATRRGLLLLLPGTAVVAKRLLGTLLASVAGCGAGCVGLLRGLGVAVPAPSSEEL